MCYLPCSDEHDCRHRYPGADPAGRIGNSLALLFLGEKFSWYKLVGTFLIITGIFFDKKIIKKKKILPYSQGLT
jgi:hypothetical protein